MKAIETAVRFYENPPAKGMTVTTHWSDIWLSAADWAEAFEAPEPGTAAQRGARPDLGGAAHDPDGLPRRRRPG